MAERSKRIELMDNDKIDKINPETIRLYNKYEADMSLRDLSENTIYNYKSDLFGWFIYIYENQGNLSVKDLTEDDITEFLYYCKKQGNNTRRIKRRMSSMSAFYKYLRKKRIVTENPLEFIDRPKHDTSVVEQTYLKKEQVAELKQKLKDNKDLQLECYVLLSLSTMARVNAVSNIKWEQIDFENRVIEKVLEKEQRLVDLFFNKEVKELLLKLKAERDKDRIDCPYVFITNYSGIDKASVSTLAIWCKKVGEMIGVPTLHPHDFRHTQATLLRNNNMPLEEVSKLLNHLSTEVTLKHYIKADTKKIQENKDKYEEI